MVDLETLGTVPGCVILSIGAVAFDEIGLSEDIPGFYGIVLKSTALEAGLHVCPKTESWWQKQSGAAQNVLRAADGEHVTAGLGPLVDVLEHFNSWLHDVHPDVRVWGNGADFDNAILAAAYRAAEVEPGWKPYNGRCYRTVKNAHKQHRLERSGTYHNALDDARSQAAHMVTICRNSGWTLA